MILQVLKFSSAHHINNFQEFSSTKHDWTVNITGPEPPKGKQLTSTMSDSVLSEIRMDRWTSPSGEMGSVISSGIFSSDSESVVLKEAEALGSASDFTSHSHDFF